MCTLYLHGTYAHEHSGTFNYYNYACALHITDLHVHIYNHMHAGDIYIDLHMSTYNNAAGYEIDSWLYMCK